MAVRYFRYFPDVKYNGYTMKDITKVAVLQDKIRSSSYTYLNYTVKEQERAEDVALFYYGDVSYVWLVYLSNQMKDPYFDWPMRQNQLEDYIQDQYLYACAVCTIKRKAETLKFMSSILEDTALMMLAISRRRSISELSFLNPTSVNYVEKYVDVWNWLQNNRNADLPTTIPDKYGIENYIAIQETLQELIDNDFDPSYTGNRDMLYDMLLSITPEGKYLWDIDGNGVLDADDIAYVKSFALGQYEDIPLLKLDAVTEGIERIIDEWLSAGGFGTYENSGEAPLFRLGRPMSFTYTYDYLLETMPDSLADIIIRIPNKNELKNTLNVLEWAQDTTVTRNVIHYENVYEPELVISADTYNLNLVGSSQSWTDFDSDEWRPLRVFDYEFLKNEEKRNIQLIDNRYAKRIEGVLEGIMK